MDNQEKLDKAIEILTAFKEGKEIWKKSYDNNHNRTDYRLTSINFIIDYLQVTPDSLYIKEQTSKEKAIGLIEAYFDSNKDILVKDLRHGVSDWININSLSWTYVERFIKSVDCYKIIDK